MVPHYRKVCHNIKLQYCNRDTYTQCQVCNECNLKSPPTVLSPHHSDATAPLSASAAGHELLHTNNKQIA